MSLDKVYKPGGLVGTNMIAAMHAAQASQAQQNQEVTEVMFLSSLGDEQLLSAVEGKATQDIRSEAAAIAVQWAQDEASELVDLDAMVFAAVLEDDEADIDELTAEQDAEYNSLYALIGEFMGSVGADSRLIQNAMEEGDEKAALDIAETIRNAISKDGADELVADFAVRESLILSAMKKVVRGGKVTFIRKRTRKIRINAAQRAALRKARTKAHTAAAKAMRRKSNRIRAKAGL